VNDAHTQVIAHWNYALFCRGVRPTVARVGNAGDSPSGTVPGCRCDPGENDEHW
jgi:hypothetical protein